MQLPVAICVTGEEGEFAAGHTCRTLRANAVSMAKPRVSSASGRGMFTGGDQLVKLAMVVGEGGDVAGAGAEVVGGVQALTQPFGLQAVGDAGDDPLVEVTQDREVGPRGD